MAEKQIKKVTSRYREIMRRLVCGESPQDIKRDIRMSDTNFSIITNSDLFIAEKEKMEKRVTDGLVKKLGEDRTLKPVDQILENAVEEAAHTDVNLMRSGSEKVRRDCAWDIMNRRGYKPKEVLDVEGAVVLKGPMADNVKKALEGLEHEPSKE